MNTKTLVNTIKKVLKIVHHTKKNSKNKCAVINSHQEEIDENAFNEALEAALAQRLASAPACDKQMYMRLRLVEAGDVSVYSGCQVAGPASR